MKTKIIIILLLLGNTVLADNHDNCFPGGERILSPSQQYEFIWKEPNDYTESRHLIYHNIKNKTEPYELLTSERSLCVHWSPDEKYFAISDYMASNIADVYIFKSDNTAERVDAMDLLPTKIKDLFKKISHG